MFDFTDAAEIATAPFLARELRAEAAHAADAAAEAGRSGGVSWSGMGAAARAGRTQDQIHADAEAAAARAAAFAATPRGRFLVALRELSELGYGVEAEKARACYSRGFASADRAPCSTEVGRAIAALVEINHPDARAAVAALGGLLTETRAAA